MCVRLLYTDINQDIGKGRLTEKVESTSWLRTTQSPTLARDVH